ncbi:MAG: hypothetical protein ABIL70_03390 [candidate division WOR-3 bacterium]
MKKNFEVILNALDELQEKKDFKFISSKYNIHHTTLWRWTKKFYKKDFFYRRPWKDISELIEERIVSIKEAKPDITLAQAQSELNNHGIKISTKIIYNIWKDYGLIRQNPRTPFSFFAPETAEAKYNLTYVQILLKNGHSSDNLKKCAEIINRLPAFPADYKDILREIPDELLTTKRKLDKLITQFLKIPLQDFYEHIKNLRIQLEREGLFYSAIKAVLLELAALTRLRYPREILNLLSHLKKIKGNLRDPVLDFQLKFFEASAYCEILQIGEAQKIAKEMRQIMAKKKYPFYYETYGELMTFMSNYRHATRYFIKTLEWTTNRIDQNRLYYKISICLTLNGRYREALKYLSKAKIDEKNKYFAHYLIARALINFGLGRIEESLAKCEQSLRQAEKEQLIGTLYSTISCYATIHCALGEKTHAERIIKNYLPILAKYGQKREIEVLSHLISIDKESPGSELPTLQLIHLLKRARQSLKIKDYRQLFIYAQRYGLVGFLQRCLFFIPELVLNVLNHGKKPDLPQALLQMPVFNPEMPSYRINFLGEVVIYKNQTYLKVNLTPKEKAFFIFLSQKIPEPERAIAIDEIFNYFWPKKDKLTGRLARFLTDFKKKIKLPKHLLVARDGHLINNGFYITNDYGEFISIITRAKALNRAKEWIFARNEYLRAFKLWRGEPLKKNFDNWSVDMRFRILTQIEDEAVSFAKICLEHDDKYGACRILQKILRIIPDAEEAKRLLDLSKKSNEKPEAPKGHPGI